jgi:hypothetical protein
VSGTHRKEDREVRSRFLLALVLPLVAAPAMAQTWSEEAALTAAVPSPDDAFGLAVDLCGDTAVVGAPFDDSAGTDTGAAFVFVRSGTDWVQQAMLTAASPVDFDEFGRAVAIEGDMLLVGAPEGGADGQVHVFERSGTVWAETAQLVPPAFVSGGFGRAIDMEGDRAAVGSYDRVWVYDRVGAVWSETQSLSGGSNTVAVALAGDDLFVNHPNFTFVNRHYWNGSTWVSGTGTLWPANAAAAYQFGRSLAAEGGTLVIGAPGEPAAPTVTTAGAVYVYVREGVTWNQKQRLQSVDPKVGERFGRSVDVQGDLVAVGAQFDKGSSASFKGAVHVFAGRGTKWLALEQLTKQVPVGGDKFGIAVALDGGRVLAGATGDDPGAVSNAGAAYLFDHVPAFTAYCTAGTSASGCRASIAAYGEASASADSGFLVTASGAEGGKSGLFVYGTGARTANPWGSSSSLRCFAPPTLRGTLQTGKGDVDTCEGWLVEDLNARWCPSCPRPQHNPGGGNTVRGQLWYRDPFNTSNQETGFSDAFEVVVAP